MIHTVSLMALMRCCKVLANGQCPSFMAIVIGYPLICFLHWHRILGVMCDVTFSSSSTFPSTIHICWPMPSRQDIFSLLFCRSLIQVGRWVLFYLLPSILLYLSPTIQQQGNFKMTRHALNSLCGRSHHYQPILVSPPPRVSPSRFFVTFISLVNSYFYQTVKSGQVFFFG